MDAPRRDFRHAGLSSVADAGNVLLAGTQVVTVTGPFGAKSTIRMHALPTILPGDSVQYSVSAGGLCRRVDPARTSPLPPDGQRVPPL